MTVETQQNHDRLLNVNGISNNAMPSANSSNGSKKSNPQQKDENFSRFSENTMQACNVNVNLMENNLASRYY